MFNLLNIITNKLQSKEIPLRVTHNDTKLSNILFDKDTDKAVCLIDLDTVMPGALAYDFGEGLRTGITTAKEDEQDVSKIHADINRFEAFTKGFLSEVKDIITEEELEMLPLGVWMMTYENAIRFLADYLNGDIYFSVDKEIENHNLIRAKAQMVKTLEEYYNAIQVNIQFSGSDIKVITVTSVQPSEGKSTTSTNLAVSFATSGYKTLLIDADIRNSVMSGTFKAEEAYHGLTSYLSGHVGLNQVIHETSVENLSIVPAGQVPPNPTTLLQNKHFEEMLEYTRRQFDYIIIDTPPIGLVVDAAIVAQKTDGSILVTESGSISRRFVKRAVEQMEQSGVPFLGVILNKVDTTKDRYGSYGSYGSYGNYGKNHNS